MLTVDSATILRGCSRVLIGHDGAIHAAKPGGKPALLIPPEEEGEYAHARVELLTSSPTGTCFGFSRGLRFIVADPNGAMLVSCGMNRDWENPHEIRFAPSGNAVAFVDDVDGGNRVRFAHLQKGYVQAWGLAWNPIGVDSGVRRFAVGQFEAFKWESSGPIKFSHLEPKPPSAEDFRLLVYDRRNDVRARLKWPFKHWEGLAVQYKGSGYVVLRERNLIWLPADSGDPTGIVANCFSRGECEGQPGLWPPWLLHADGDLALVSNRRAERTVLVHRQLGIVWDGSGVRRASLEAGHLLAETGEGAVLVLRCDNFQRREVEPVSGKQTLAAAIEGGVLRIAYLDAGTDTLEILDHGL